KKVARSAQGARYRPRGTSTIHAVRARGSALWLWLARALRRSVALRRRPQDLEVDRLFPDQPLQLTDLLLRCPQFARRDHVLVRRHGGFTALRNQMLPALQDAARDPQLPAQLRERDLATG